MLRKEALLQVPFGEIDTGRVAWDCLLLCALQYSEGDVGQQHLLLLPVLCRYLSTTCKQASTTRLGA